MAEETSTQSKSIASEIQSQMNSFYSKLPIKKKLLLLAILIFSMIGLGILVLISQQSTWISLFSGLTPKEVSKITQKLDESQIEYKIAAGGGGILVPAEMADKAKLDVAGSDLLNGGIVGLEIFDNSGFTMTEFQQNVQLRRAIEGELSRLVSQINLIETAKVLLAMPEKTVFIDNERSTTAAVHVITKSDSPLTGRVVRTILNLIASGVPGLSVDNVKISDQYGNLYTSAMQDTAYSDENKSLVYKHNVEQYLENKILDQLQKIIGNDGLKVKVSAEIDNESQTIEENLVDPELTAVLSEQTSQESTSGSRTLPAGAPGITSNSPEINSSFNEVANVAESDRRTKQVNYENSRRRIQREILAGKINRLTVSVLLDDKPIISETSPGVFDLVKEKWSSDELSQISLIAQTAIGFDEQRGDSIQVRNITFNTPIEDSIKASGIDNQAKRDLWINIAKYVLAAFISIAMLLLLIRPVIKRLSPTSEELEINLGLPSTVANLERSSTTETPNMSDEITSEVNGTEEDAGQLLNRKKQPQTRAKILEMAKANTEETARTLRIWLKEA